MTRLQKKCLIAVVGTHLLVLVVILCSGFITSATKPDDSQVLDVIPSKAVDAAMSSGVRSAQPPPPAPLATPPKPITPTPPEVKPVEPVRPVEPVKPPDDAKPDDQPEPKPKPAPHKISPNMTPVVHKTTTEPDDSEAEAKAAAKAAKEAKRERDKRAQAFKNAASAIKENTSQSTTVDMPGDSTVAYANYASIVKTVYTEAWQLPQDTSSDDANVKVSVTIANDGRVMQAHIVEPSGDASVDRSVQSTLDRVTELEPFPDGTTDKERTYIINFNLKAKRQMLG